MKKLFTLTFIFFAAHIFSQDSISTFNYNRNQITLTGMKVLGTWGIINAGTGAIGWAGSNGTNKYFYQMNTLWGVVNAGVAFLGYSNAKKSLNKQLNNTASLNAQQKIEKTFLINGGLDFAYIGTGIYLRNRGNNKDDDKLKGYGSSVGLQGIFLLVFDATMYNIQKANGNKLQNFLQKNSVSFNGNSIGLVHTL